MYRNDDKDAFWDLSSLLPPRKQRAEKQKPFALNKKTAFITIITREIKLSAFADCPTPFCSILPHRTATFVPLAERGVPKR